MSNNTEEPTVSVIVRAFNEERHLPRLLAALGRQERRDHEVILVDSGSTDRTIELAASARARIVQISPEEFSFGRSLNTGIRAARGEYIAVVSAHACPVDECWLQTLVRPLAKPNIAMVYGRQVGTPESKFSEARDFARIFGDQWLVQRAPQFFANNANAALRRSLWGLEPFDEDLPGLEDIGWAKTWMERGHDVVYEPGAVVSHTHEETWLQVRNRYRREGVAAATMGLRRRRGLARELWKETLWLRDDLGAAWRTGAFPCKWREILRFRFEKSAGTLAGVWTGRRSNAGKQTTHGRRSGWPRTSEAGVPGVSADRS